MRDIVKTVWRQVLPLPPQCDFLICVEGEGGGVEWCDLSTEGWAPLALVWAEFHVRLGGSVAVEHDLALYLADAAGYRELERDYRAVPRGMDR